MRRTLRRRYPYLIAGLVILVVAIALLLLRSAGAEDYGPELALCPGPDAYGYTCDSADGYAYIDATIDTRLYADDGMVTLDLPFPFTFYGTTYTQLHASSNGNIQFNSENAAYHNVCLNERPASGMGDMIAPYWHDLDLRFVGYLEYEVVGESPNRVFVLEWDSVPPLGANENDTVTFAVQLFENNNDIVFMYEDVETLEGANGRSATIGLQSQTQGVALQYGCNVRSVNSGNGVAFPAPETPNNDYGMRAIIPLPTESVATKGRLASTIQALQDNGSTDGLRQLQSRWQAEQVASDWAQLDDNLLLLWQTTKGTELAVIAPNEAGQLTPIYQHAFATRTEPNQYVELSAVADITHDAQSDAILTNKETGDAFLFDGITLSKLPYACTGETAVVNRNERLSVARDGCEDIGRVLIWWENGRWQTE